MEMYTQMVQETKNARLRYLLNETDSYIEIINKMIQDQRAESGAPMSMSRYDNAPIPHSLFLLSPTQPIFAVSHTASVFFPRSSLLTYYAFSLSHFLLHFSSIFYLNIAFPRRSVRPR